MDTWFLRRWPLAEMSKGLIFSWLRSFSPLFHELLHALPSLEGWLFWSHHHWSLKIGHVCSMLQVEFLKQKTSCKLALWDSSYYSSFCSVSPQALHGLLALPTTSRRICPNFWSNAPAASCTFLSRSCAPTPGLTDGWCFGHPADSAPL